MLLVQENKLALDEKISREPGLGVPLDKLRADGSLYFSISDLVKWELGEF
jgi:hypothetical protein